MDWRGLGCPWGGYGRRRPTQFGVGVESFQYGHRARLAVPRYGPDSPGPSACTRPGPARDRQQTGTQTGGMSLAGSLTAPDSRRWAEPLVARHVTGPKVRRAR